MSKHKRAELPPLWDPPPKPGFNYSNSELLLNIVEEGRFRDSRTEWRSESAADDRGHHWAWRAKYALRHVGVAESKAILVRARTKCPFGAAQNCGFRKERRRRWLRQEKRIGERPPLDRHR